MYTKRYLTFVTTAIVGWFADRKYKIMGNDIADGLNVCAIFYSLYIQNLEMLLWPSGQTILV